MKKYLNFLKPFQPKLSPCNIRTVKGAKVLVTQIPFPIIEVQTRDLIDYAAVPYASKHHPHQRALAALDGYAALGAHFAEFQPRSLEDLWGISDPFLAETGVQNLSVRGPFGTLPLCTQPLSGNCAHFGPANMMFVASEWQRLSSCSKGLRNGYRPWTHWDGFLRGIFITDGTRHRFLVTAGKHRAAVVAQRMKVVQVRLEWNSNYVPVVDTRRIADLPQVQASVWKAEVAIKVAEFFLEGRDYAVR